MRHNVSNPKAGLGHCSIIKQLLNWKRCPFSTIVCTAKRCPISHHKIPEENRLAERQIQICRVPVV